MHILKLFTTNRARLAAGLAVFLRLTLLATIVLAAPGGVVVAPTEVAPGSGIPIAPNFAFELEAPPQSLKEVPVWWELEQMLDNPYAMALAGDPNLAEEVSGFPAYVTTILRRRSYLPPGCSYDVGSGLPLCNDALLQPFLVHPLNYNHMNGEELRLLNPAYPGGLFDVPGEMVQCSGDPNNTADPSFCHEETTANSLAGPVVSPADDPNRWVWAYATVEVSPGVERVEETSIDFNSPMRPDIQTPYTTFEPRFPAYACMVTTELNPPEGSILCGGDPGIPGYAGFGVLDLASYSVPAVPGVADPTTPTAGELLYDPAGCDDRNAELPGSCVPTADGGGNIVKLLKPTVRNTASGQPDYLQNSMTNLAEFGLGGTEALTASNENDYYRGNTLAEKLAARDEAAALGKALFWDMQVGSDGVQACASCHFSAGADDRTKNQMNPNHIGFPADTTFQLHQPNEELVATDFPFSNGGDTANHNDVASSMGVHFGVFGDIPAIGSFVANASGVNALPIDQRNPAANNVDPILGFAGITGNEFRRVEPRNTPTLINADFNFDNFWDGRARHDFNGGSVFGAADPQAHVFACDLNSNATNCTPQSFAATRQIIRNVSLASLATGPGLSEFEMSQVGRNWAKIGKKLLQGATTTSGSSQLADNVTPLANQLVDPNDSVLGKYSNQGGSACTTASIPLTQRSGSWASNTNPGLAVGKPGLCISYSGLIEKAFYPQLWISSNRALQGAPDPTDPFDGYSLTVVNDGINTPPERQNTTLFTQMEANFSLFWGLSIHAWGAILISDDAPFDQMMDANPDSFKSLGEANEPGLVRDMLGCDQTGGVQPCYTEIGPFKRDPGIPLNLDPLTPGFEGVTTGTRVPGDPDPLLGFDIFYGFNLSGKNPEFRTTRCGECHAGGTTTDHTMEISNQLSFGDFVAEFSVPGVEIVVEPLGRNRVISGFSLEGELNGSAQDGLERRIANQNQPGPFEGITLHYPDGASFFDNGMYNIGVTPCAADYAGTVTGECNDIARGGDDPFGWPLSLAALMMKNLGGVDFEPGVPMDTFDPDLGISGGLFEPTAQDQQINPGFEDEPANPLLPPHLAPFASNITVGDEVEQDEAGGGGGGMINTAMEVPILEGFVDTIGPFNPAGTIGETYNMAPSHPMGTWTGGTLDGTASVCHTDPTAPGCVNRVGRSGSFKAPSIRNVELTGPYFHNGGKLTLGQVLDFYLDGGDFPNTNSVHRDFNIMNLLVDGQALGNLPVGPGYPTQEEAVTALIDFVLTLTDERVRNEQAPFDHPEIFVPLDGRAPENSFGRPGFVAGTTGDVNGVTPDCAGVPGAGACFLRIPAVGAGGLPALGLPPVDGFLGVVVGDRNNPNCSVSAGPISQYCVDILP